MASMVVSELPCSRSEVIHKLARNVCEVFCSIVEKGVAGRKSPDPVSRENTDGRKSAFHRSTHVTQTQTKRTENSTVVPKTKTAISTIPDPIPASQSAS